MKRVPRLLLVALALSLFVHLLVALILHPPVPTPENQAEVVSIEHRPATIALTKPPTPPPPHPKASPALRTRASAPPARKGPVAVGTSGGRTAPPEVVATATPQPAVTATNAGCSRSSTAAAVVGTPAPPDIPLETRASATSGVALVAVQLDSGGQVTGTSVAQSTGNSSLDLVAVAMARDARYTAALRDCKPVASAYSFSVKFAAW